MASGYVQVPADSTGKKVDCVSLSAGGNTVVRQTVVVADPTSSAGFATVTGGKLNVNASVGGTVAVSVAATLGVTGTVALAAGTANIGTIDGISKTVAVSIAATLGVTGTVVLAAGTANIGTLDGISKTVNVSITNNVNVSNTPSVVVAAFADPSGNNRNVVDSANTALRVNVVAGGAGGGIVTGPAAPGASVTAGNNPVLMGGADPSSLARVLRVDATGGLIVSNISATVNVAGTFTIGTIDKISATTVVAGEVAAGSSLSTTNKAVLVGGNDSAGGGVARTLLLDTSGRIILGAGAQNIGTIDGISKTVAVSIAATLGVTGTVVLAAGTANIGTLDGISKTVNVSVTNNVNISNTPSVVLAAGSANIGTLDGISKTVNVSVTNNVNISNTPSVIVAGPVAFNASVTAGNNPVLAGGRVKTSISTTATAHAAVWAWFDKAGHQIVQLNAASLHPSSTHGPKTVTLSASANTVLVASAGTAVVFVDSIMVTSNLAAVTRCDIYETPSSAAPEVSAYLGIGGGGFTQKFDPPWQLSAGQALSARLKPSASAQVLVTVHFHVGPA